MTYARFDCRQIGGALGPAVGPDRFARAVTGFQGHKKARDWNPGLYCICRPYRAMTYTRRGVHRGRLGLLPGGPLGACGDGTHS